MTEGIDPDVVEILNMKLKDIVRQFNIQLQEKNNQILFLTEKINKYKLLMPKSK